MRGPLMHDDILDRVMVHFDDVYEQLNALLKQVAHNRQEIDRLIAKQKQFNETRANNALRRR